MDNSEIVIENLNRSIVNLYKLCFEEMGYDLGATYNKIEYKNYLYDNPIHLANTDESFLYDNAPTKLTKEDMKHSLDFDTFYNLVLKNVSKNSEKFTIKNLDKFYEQIMDFAGYYNDKYYRAGFGDCLNLVIMSLGGNGIETK